jgi:hypothetical protein
MSKVFIGAWCWLACIGWVNAANAGQMTRLNCEVWLKENSSGYMYMVEGYLLGLYHYQSLVGNPSGTFAPVSTKDLPEQVRQECKKNPQANVGDIASSLKLQIDLKNTSQ